MLQSRFPSALNFLQIPRYKVYFGTSRRIATPFSKKNSAPALIFFTNSVLQSAFWHFSTHFDAISKKKKSAPALIFFLIPCYKGDFGISLRISMPFGKKNSAPAAPLKNV